MMWTEIEHAFNAYLNSFAGSIPAIINALVILGGGWILAKFIQWIVYKLSHWLGLDRLAKKSAVHRFLERKGYKKGLSGLMALLVYSLILLIVFVKFFELIGLQVVSDLLNQLILFIPNVFFSVVVLILGFYLAEFVSGLVSGLLEESRFHNPTLIGRLVFYCIAFFTIAISLTQIGIGEALITNVVSIFFGSIGLAFALAFGLGGKEWAAEIIKKFFSVPPDKE